MFKRNGRNGNSKNYLCSGIIHTGVCQMHLLNLKHNKHNKQ